MRAIVHGATDQSIVVRFVDSTDGTPETGVTDATSGLALWYRRETGLKVAITPASLAALDTAHTDGGVEHISDGYVRIDVPDAAFASGAVGVAVGGSATGMVVIGAYHPLVAYNPQDAVRLGLTALPNAAADAAGGLPISDAGGLDLDAQRTDVAAILVDTNELQADWTNAGRLDAILDDILVDTGTTLDTVVDAIKVKTDQLVFTATNQVDANILGINSVAGGVAALDRSTRSIVLGTVGAASTTTSIVTSALAPAVVVADQLKGRIVIFDEDTTTTALRGQATDITASTDAGVLTTTALTTAPVSGDTFVVH